MSLCDTCPSPGYCCKNMRFNGESLAHIDSKTVMDFLEYNIGPHPFYIHSHDTLGVPVWGCKNLNWVTGRCMDYENRPQLCKDYEPASDYLCIRYEEE